MKRNVSLDEISDGRLYRSEDMAKLGCNDCSGCSACCQDMGKSAILDPRDLYMLCENLHTSFDRLLSEYIELNMVDGLILPNIKMQGQTNACGFLGSDGRCRIHEFRPGVCRLFPLGRFYEEDGFKYFLQVHECKKENRSKVKIKKWLGISELNKYEQYITDWHNYLMDMEAVIAGGAADDTMKKLVMFILELFYRTPYDVSADFYEQFYKRMETARKQNF